MLKHEDNVLGKRVRDLAIVSFLIDDVEVGISVVIPVIDLLRMLREHLVDQAALLNTEGNLIADFQLAHESSEIFLRHLRLIGNRVYGFAFGAFALASGNLGVARSGLVGISKAPFEVHSRLFLAQGQHQSSWMKIMLFIQKKEMELYGTCPLKSPIIEASSFAERAAR